MSAKLIPERLKFVRENMGITMAEASRRLNLSKIGYCRYETERESHLSKRWKLLLNVLTHLLNI